MASASAATYAACTSLAGFVESSLLTLWSTAAHTYTHTRTYADAHPLRMLAAGIVFGIIVVRLVLRWIPAKREPTVYSQLNCMANIPQPLRRAASPSLRDPAHPGVIVCVCPSTQTFLGHVKVTSAQEVQAMVDKARAVQRAWARTTFAERRRVLQRLSEAILAQADEIVRLSCIDTGKPRTDAMFGEIAASLGKIDWVIARGESVLRPEVRVSSFTSMHKRSVVTYEPFGVIGVIAPWNYPFYNMYNHIASGLFAGNAVVCKMSEYSAWSAERFVRVARDVLGACGYDSDLVQLVQGFGETGAALVNSADKIIFTGSPGIGKAVMKGASSTLTPLVLELGGKDPFIVCEDAPLDTVVAYSLRGSFQNSGQNCVGIERIYVYESIYDDFVARAKEIVSQMRVGPPVDLATGEFNAVDMGPITTAPQLQLIQELVDDAVSKGARLLVGGRSRYGGPASDPLSKGLFFEPTLLVDVTHEMRIANEEVFGPVMTVLKVERDSDDVAVACANSTSYGLGATVFSNSPARANAIAARLRCGMVGINAYGLNYLNQDLPFGGVGASGFERFSGPEGLRACCVAKAVVTDMLPFLSIPTPVPAPLRYPVAAVGPAAAWALIQLQYAATWPERLVGLIGMIINNSRTLGPVCPDARNPTVHSDSDVPVKKVAKVDASTAQHATAQNGHAAAPSSRRRRPSAH